MKRSIAFITALILSAGCLVSCGKKKEESAAYNDSLPEVVMPLQMPDVNIAIPEKYEKKSTDSNDTVFVYNDASIIVNSDKFKDDCNTLDAYVERAIDIYKKCSDDIEFLKNEPITAVNIDGKLVEYIYTLNTDNGSFKKYVMAAFFSDEEKVYLITCKADPDNYQSYHEEFIDVVKSFGFK